MQFLETLFNWAKLVSIGPDAVAYFVMAVVGTVLFFIRLGITFFLGGDGGDFDTDMDAGVDTDATFSFFSVGSILAFFMGAGWMGLACRVDWNLNGLATAFISSGFGFVMMLMASALMALTRKINATKDYDVKTAVGKVGRVYLNIPEKGEGHGQVEVTVSGRRKIMRAMSTGPAIKSMSDIRVVEAREDETMVVEPLE